MLANTSDLPKTRQWITQKRVWCIQKYLETKSFVKTQQNFLHRFGTELAPTKSPIFKMVKKFQYAGTVNILNKKCKDRETHSGKRDSASSMLLLWFGSQLNSHQNDRPEKGNKPCPYQGLQW
ncbi:hypothetical protein LOD99_11217 [Oopsacas minuta]|uniref:DUF4817 domain-containing protein n=1 Tax=Oopsacas minuta TaxID=111878 RepID=A0AAV7K7A9_9METZ|nr:hypothetical protein LOD99_11217 [Oopsacas minuta]